MIERVATAIDEVQLFSRFNNWTSDRVEGCPIEICRYGADDEEDIVVVARFGGDITESEALQDTISKARARAAIEAVREGLLEELRQEASAYVSNDPEKIGFEAAMALIDAALSPPVVDPHGTGV